MTRTNARVRCEECGGKVLADKLVELDGDLVCPPCVKRREPVPQLRPKPGFKWYVIQVADKENKVRRELLRHVVDAGLSTDVDKVVIARAPELRERGGRMVTHYTKAFNKYLLVHCHYSESLFLATYRVPGVVGWLPRRPEPKSRVAPTEFELEEMAAWAPTPLSDQERRGFLSREVARRGGPPPVRVPFEKGDPVRIVGGPYEGQRGVVTDIVDEGTSPLAGVTLTVLGRPIRVTVPYHLVTKEAE